MSDWISVQEKMPEHRALVEVKVGFFKRSKLYCDRFCVPVWRYPSGLFYRRVEDFHDWRPIE